MVKVTPSARTELLELVARLKRRSPEAAERFILEVEDRLAAVAAGDHHPPELSSPWRSAGAADGHRLYLRERADALWLIAMWPDTAVDQSE
jgi:hypothetical protein